MPAIYQSYEFKEGDTLTNRQDKLYLGVISCGEDLYCLGAAVGEMIKKLNAYEEEIRRMRAESLAIRQGLRAHGETDCAALPYLAMLALEYNEIAER